MRMGSGLALAIRHVAKCENKSHVAKEMPHAFATVAKRFFSDDRVIWRKFFPPLTGWAYLGLVRIGPRSAECNACCAMIGCGRVMSNWVNMSRFEELLINNCRYFNRVKRKEYFLAVYQWKEPSIYEKRRYNDYFWLLLRDCAPTIYRRAIFRAITIHIGPIPVYTLHVCKDSLDGD